MQTAVATTRTPAEHPNYPISLSDLAQALDHSDEGFALTDPDGNYVYINDAHLRIYGYERPQDLLGRSWRVLYTPEWVRHFEESVLPIMPRDLVWRGQVIGKKRDGSSFLAGVTLTLLPDGKITCNCRDESVGRERPDAPAAKQAEPKDSGERAALRELGERIVAGLPAKLRRPVEMLTGYSSFFLEELQSGRSICSDTLRCGVNEIAATGRRLAEQMRRLELVAELAARDGSGNIKKSNRTRNSQWTNELAAECEKKASSYGRPSDLQVSLDYAPVRMDIDELKCVASELLANAFQSSSAGDAVKVCGKVTPEGYALRVCDEGVGLHASCLDELEDRPFGQGSPCGFGLALVRYILRKNNASIALDRTQPGTTCIKVTLPAV